MKHCVMLSYPRSGNTFTRYMFECITGVSTAQKKYHGDGHIVNKRLLSNTKESNRVDLVKCHNSPNESVDIFVNDEFHSMIFLLRNPVETLARHNGYDKFANRKKIDNLIESELSSFYFDNCKIFLETKKPKLLLYYEDMILDCGSYYKSLYDFCDSQGYIVDSSLSISVDDFMKDLSVHKSRCLKIYSTSKSKGNSINYHSSKIKKENIDYFMTKLIDQHANLFETILKRYKLELHNEKNESI